ncbi:MAG: nitrilase-related carbon-nitrogen hydrolase [candidate division WOR-3 bacterium]
MRAGFLQFSPKRGDISANLDLITGRLEEVKADLIVLPELCLSGYLFASRAELCQNAIMVPQSSEIVELTRLCQQRRFNLVLGIAEAEDKSPDSKFYITALLITTGGTIHKYRKAHLFGNEKNLFTAGNDPFPVFNVDGVKIGLLVCFDYFFPEAARTLALRGAQIICHPANLILHYAQSITITRAVENRVYWILSSRTGEEQIGSQHLRFTGTSQIVAPDGRVLFRASPDQQELAIVDIDPNRALDKQVTAHNNVLLDRRTDLYRLGPDS